MLLKIKTHKHITYYNSHSERHRNNDLPAMIWTNGTQAWYQDGKLHRDNDLPAIVYRNGDQYWYCNGKFIRSETT